MSTMRNEAAELLGEILEMEVDASKGLSRSAVPGWDSLKHLEVVMGFEEEFDVRLTVEQVDNISSFDDLVALIETGG